MRGSLSYIDRHREKMRLILKRERDKVERKKKTVKIVLRSGK